MSAAGDVLGPRDGRGYLTCVPKGGRPWVFARTNTAEELRWFVDCRICHVCVAFHGWPMAVRAALQHAPACARDLLELAGTMPATLEWPAAVDQALAIHRRSRARILAEIAEPRQ